MKKVRKTSLSKILSNIIMAVINLCFCAINFLSANNFYGNWYFNSVVILYSLGIILGVACLILSIIEFRSDSIISFTQIWLFIICLFLVPMLIFESVNYYKDLYNGITEFETEIYEIPVENYYAEYPDEPKSIGLFCNGYYRLDISDYIYFDLVNNNPLDKTRTVYYSALGWETYPHLHYIRVKFHKYTKIVDEIQILYD